MKKKKKKKLKKRKLYACKDCGKITTTTSKEIFKLKVCPKCRIKKSM